jgi:hypothetical protein
VQSMTWLVELANAQPQEFLDLQDIGDRYYQLRRGFLDKLRALVEQAPNYHLRVGAIQSARGSDGAVIVPFILLLVTSAGLTVSFLGSITDKGHGRIVGVWPAQFRGVLKADQDAILNLLYIATERPEAVRHLELVF